LVDVERIFSKGRLLLPHVRNQLSAESTRSLICLNNWTKLGYVKQEYLKDASKLPEVVASETEMDDSESDGEL
jgi:hypothetical protein